jgi:hypothetical protein
MRVLLAEQRIHARTLLDLVRAAADAHLHPGSLVAAPAERARNTVGAALGCWVAFVVSGAGFAQLTEEHAFGAAGTAHPVLGVARLAVTVIAGLATATVVLAGRRLIAEVLREARTGPRSLRYAAYAPLLAVAAFTAATGGLAWVAGPGGAQAHSAAAWITLLAWFAIGLGGAVVCALAPRAALRLSHPTPRALRSGVRGAVVLTAALVSMTSASAVYAVAVTVDAPSLATAATGPFGLISTTIALSIVVVLMALISALAATTSLRGLRALGRS